MPIQPAKPTLKPGALLAGKYRLLKMLGRGAAGVVWSAVNTTTSRKVALKLLLNPAPKQRERLLREARAAGALSHPNVIDIYDVTQAEDGNPVLVLELLEGETLQHLIDERAPLPPLEAAGIGRDVARALAVAHASGIVHRDLKPSNIFMHQPGDDPAVVKVVDFGISKNLLAGEGTLTETGMAVGSPAFMSPEQVRGERTLDGRTDLWALGVILYEMLAGKRLFDGRTHEVLTQVLVEPIKPIDRLVPGIDPALASVVHGLLERDVNRRLSSAEEAAERLATVAGGPKETSPRRSVAAPAPAGEPHDTTVVPRPMTEAKITVPKAYVDEEEEEPTHVAPFAMRAALAKQTVPSVYNDDEEEDEDRTKVASDAVLTAAIRASRSNEVPDSGIATVRPPPMDEPRSDQNAVPTVRPPSMEVPAMAEPSPESVRARAAASVKTPVAAPVKVPAAAKASGGAAAKAPVPAARPSGGGSAKAPVPAARPSGGGSAKAPVPAAKASGGGPAKAPGPVVLKVPPPPVEPAQPPASDPKPEAVEPARPATSHAKAEAHDAQPAASGAKPAAVDLAQPATSEAKPATSDAKPATSDAKPATSDAKPAAASDAQPATSDAKPAAASDAKPAAASDAKPAAASDAKPAASDAKPAAADVDFGGLISVRSPPASAKSGAADAAPPSGDLFHLSGGAPATPEAAPSPVPVPASGSAPEVPAPQGRNKLMIAGAVVFLLLAVVIFVTQFR